MKSTDTTDVHTSDVVVLGGGITGLAVARAAARKNLQTILLEKDRIGCATSANSLRIIHGGFRYLQNLNLPRVIRSIKDQARVVREFSDLVRPLPCYLPLKQVGLKSRWPLTGAALFYRLITSLVGERPIPARVVDREQAEKSLPLLCGGVPFGAFCWSDVQLLDPSALHQRLAEEISASGGTVGEHHLVLSVERRSGNFEVVTRSAAGEKRFHARTVVDARGQWLDLTRLPQSSSSRVGWCRAFNLVYRGNPFGVFGAGMSTDDGRLLFAVGRENEIAVGTEYLSLGDSTEAASISGDEVTRFHDKIRRAFPRLGVERDAVLRIEAGVLPIDSRIASAEDALIGSARLTNDNGYISVLSTKYTTFLSQADEVLGMIEASRS